MLVRARTADSCRVYRFEGGVSAWTILKSVGLGGVNRKEDVLTIQTLLNPAVSGLPSGWREVEDGERVQTERAEAGALHADAEAQRAEPET